MNRSELDNKLEKALQSEPSFQLHEDFADQMVAKIIRRQTVEDRKQAFLMIGSIMGFLILSVVSLLVYLDEETLNQLMGMTGWAVVVGLLVVVIQVLDRKILSHGMTVSN